MDSLIKFRWGRYTVTFPQVRQVSLFDNFRNLRMATSTVVGKRGSIDEYGSDVSPGGEGLVQVVYYLQAADAAAMYAQLAQMKRMASMGRGWLWKQPQDPTLLPRWCRAKINSVDAPQNVSNRPHVQQRVQISFHVDDPLWYDDALYQYKDRLGEAVLGDGVARWAGVLPISITSSSFTGGAYDLSVCEGPVRPRLVLHAQVGGGTVSNPSLWWQYTSETAGYEHDRVTFNGGLAEGDVLDIDCGRGVVRLNGVPAYEQMTFTRRPELMELPPGESITLGGTVNSGQMNLYARVPRAFF